MYKMESYSTVEQEYEKHARFHRRENHIITCTITLERNYWLW